MINIWTKKYFDTPFLDSTI
jgi:hypothetical protein